MQRRIPLALVGKFGNWRLRRQTSGGYVYATWLSHVASHGTIGVYLDAATDPRTLPHRRRARVQGVLHPIEVGTLAGDPGNAAGDTSRVTLLVNLTMLRPWDDRDPAPVTPMPPQQIRLGKGVARGPVSFAPVVDLPAVDYVGWHPPLASLACVTVNHVYGAVVGAGARRFVRYTVFARPGAGRAA